MKDADRVRTSVDLLILMDRPGDGTVCLRDTDAAATGRGQVGFALGDVPWMD